MHEKITDYYTMTNEVLGEGYFAIVKKGVDKKTGAPVAIKIINKDLVEKEETLRNEIEILSKVDHPNIVKMHAIFDTPEHLFIVMELMEGGELYQEIISRSTYSENEAVEIMRQLLSALVYLHDMNIAHRDLKLENLLLQKAGQLTVKLADFGLSKLFSGSGDMKTACGTPFYVAPDILLATDEEGYGPPVDMWAVGILLYILLSGRLPFSGEEDQELYANIIECQLEWKSPQFDTVSDDAKDLISKLVTLEPTDRLTASQALQHRWITNTAGTSAPLHSSFHEGLRAVSNLNKKNDKK